MVALVVGAVAFVTLLTMAAAIRRIRLARTRTARIVCPRSGLEVEATLAVDRAGNCVDVEACSALTDPEYASACTRGCLDVVNLRLARDDAKEK